MKDHIAPAIRLTFVLLVLTSGLYPLVVWGIGQVVFPDKANGSLIVSDGKIIGSTLIAQPFASDRFFHPRPSAAGGDGYDAMASSGSNLGPTSRKLHDRMVQSIADWKDERPASGIPADALTASGSGLDPHITPGNARAQAARVAQANDLAIEEINRLIAAHTEGRFLGVYGEPRVNVLAINLALSQRGKTSPR